jgi:hypothetical protein
MIIKDWWQITCSSINSMAVTGDSYFLMVLGLRKVVKLSILEGKPCGKFTGLSSLKIRFMGLDCETIFVYNYLGSTRLESLRNGQMLRSLATEGIKRNWFKPLVIRGGSLPEGDRANGDLLFLTKSGIQKFSMRHEALVWNIPQRPDANH